MQHSWDSKYKRASLHSVSPSMFYFCHNYPLKPQKEPLVSRMWRERLSANPVRSLSTRKRALLCSKFRLLELAHIKVPGYSIY